MKFKSLSPMIAEVLMIVLVVGIGIFFVSWTEYFSQSSKEKTDERYRDTIECSNVFAQLDVLFIKKVSTDVRMLITNKGNLPYVVNGVELYNAQGDVCKVTNITEILPGESVWIDFKCQDGFINECYEFRSIYISSECIDKSLTFGGVLEDTGSACRYEKYL